MAQQLTRAKALQNAAFLRRLEATGNVRLAAEQAGVSYRTMQRRRVAHPAFAQRWDAALAVAQARLGGVKQSTGDAGGERPSTTCPSGPARLASREPAPGGDMPPACRWSPSAPLPEQDRGGSRTKGGEAVVVKRKDGTRQIRRAHPGKLTRAAEQAFLAALSATCNVRLAAAAAGAQCTHFYRRRNDSPAFAREWRMALEQGYRGIELALLESWMPEAYEHDAWRSNDPPAIPPITPNQALQLMYLHQKEVLGRDEPWPLRLQPGETSEMRSVRLNLMYEQRQERAREEFRVAEAARRARGEPGWWDEALGLPDLAQITGWSRADPAKQPHDEERALFGGWRIEDMEEGEGRGPSRK